MNRNFGKYDIPPTLKKVMDFQNVLGDSEQFFSGFHFYLSLENFRYFNTPTDVVVFGHIGANGIHYGFLTDYGTATNLESAPIVCVSPMDSDRPTRIISNNFRDFLSVNMNDSGLFYNNFVSEGHYLAAKKKWDAQSALSAYQPSQDENLARKKNIRFLTENLQIPIIENPYKYIKIIEIERRERISIQTEDKIGVTTPLRQNEKPIPFDLDKDKYPDLKLLQEYLNSAPIPSRLALIRNIQLYYVLQDYHELNKIVVESLIKIGLIDEANRLSK